MDPFFLKLPKYELTQAITHILICQYQQGVFLSNGKFAKIVPFHKKESVVLPENYRPVALLNVLSKILEKHVFLQLMDWCRFPREFWEF